MYGPIAMLVQSDPEPIAALNTTYNPIGTSPAATNRTENYPEYDPIYYYDLPGFQFWGSATENIEADRNYTIIVPMQQITRQLEFDFTIASGDTTNIDRINWADLWGIASGWNCEMDTPVGNQAVMSFDLIREGNKLTGMTRLLGLHEDIPNTLYISLYKEAHWLYGEYDLSELLKGFNDGDRTTPIVIKGEIHVPSVESGLDIEITNCTVE